MPVKISPKSQYNREGASGSISTATTINATGSDQNTQWLPISPAWLRGCARTTDSAPLATSPAKRAPSNVFAVRGSVMGEPNRVAEMATTGKLSSRCAANPIKTTHTNTLTRSR